MCSGTTYPLDIVRARLSIATASIPIIKSQPATAASTLKPSLTNAFHTLSHAYSPSELTMWGMAMKIVREGE